VRGELGTRASSRFNYPGLNLTVPFQVPRSTQAPAPSFERLSVLGAKLATPLGDRFLGHGDLPLVQEVFDVEEARPESVIG
jgi:hypothetical protein